MKIRPVKETDAQGILDIYTLISKIQPSLLSATFPILLNLNIV